MVLEDKTIKKTMLESLENVVNAKKERQRNQKQNLKKLSEQAQKNKLYEGAEIIFLWKKLAKELNSGQYIGYLESEVKDKIFKHYEYLIFQAVNRYGNNLYLTSFELIEKLQKAFWDEIASFAYFILNEVMPKKKEFSENVFLSRTDIFLKTEIDELIQRERQKFLGYNGITYFIYKNPDGSVDKISYCENDGKTQSYGVFIGSDEEKHKLADEYEKKWLALEEAEKILYEKSK